MLSNQDDDGLAAALSCSAVTAVPPEVLRRWTVASQHAYWEQRWRLWLQKPIAELQDSCKMAGLWPSGSVNDLCSRLALHDYLPSELEPAQWLGGSPPLDLDLVS